MITFFKVEGFKSLRDFEIHFNRGLNVLIGPNAAGKTNICQALGLVAASAKATLSDYILSLGGARGTFTIEPRTGRKQHNSRAIKASVRGEIRIENQAENKGESANLRYEYFFLVEFEKELKLICETFTLRKLMRSSKYRKILEVQRHGQGDLFITIKDRDEIGPTKIDAVLRAQKKTSFEVREFPAHSCLVYLSTLIWYCYKVCEDMESAQTWNIDPHLAKEPSDVLQKSSLSADGRYLSNAIYRLFHTRSKELAEIAVFLSQLLPTFDKLAPETSEDGSKRWFKIRQRNGIECPSQCLSDGTVKMIALLVGIYGQKTATMIIEEPENHLHPWACDLLIDFLRDHFTEGGCVLTTHSESVLNRLRPEEIIVVENKDGYTRATRLSEDREVVDAIIKSGFGCGYHYVSGSLGGVPR